MIYLKPEGGLCNRMRAMDSALSLCNIHKNDLTVIWVNDSALNCSFEKIFIKPSFKNFELKIIECPEGFPELYIPLIYGENIPEKMPALRYHINIYKHGFVPAGLNKYQKELLKKIVSIPYYKTLLNISLYNIYSSKKYITLSFDQIDDIFIHKISNMINYFFMNNTESCYISSCYRFYPDNNNFASFIPVNSILNKVEAITCSFLETTGVHIRRSDHITSKKYSTTEKFKKAMEKAMDENPETNFFLSTDDKSIKENFISEFKGKIIVNNVSSYKRNISEGITDAVIDLYCLAKTKKILGSHHSTFSQIAAKIGGIKEYTVK